MVATPWNFDPDKAVEAILFTSTTAGTTLYETLKLLYLADKLHLERYGRLIFGDHYVAMEHGPVGSDAYDVMTLDAIASTLARSAELIQHLADPHPDRV
ncbi:MAG: Panacea domain-containing protein [Gammaproteobacteria bacterium]